MNTHDCENCGAALPRREEKCSYCGTANANYQPPTLDLQTLLIGACATHAQKRYAEAERMLRHILVNDPEIFDAYFYLADCLLQQNRIPEAIRAMQAAQALRPGNCSLQYNLGILLQQRGEVSRAREYLHRAGQLAETDPAVTDRPRMRQLIQNALAS